MIMPGDGSDTNRRSPRRFAMAWPLKPVVLCFPDHSSGVSRQDQVGARKPSTSTVCSRADRFLCFVGGRPVLFGGRLDKRREFRDDSRDHRLRRIEYFRPDFLRYVLSHIAACHNDSFSQSKVLRTPDSFMPRLFKLIFDAPYQLVELLCVKP